MGSPSNKILKFSLPSPVNLSSWWNFGSLLGIMLGIQIVSGLFLSMHYSPHLSLAFDSIIHIINDVNFGWLIRYIHINGASFFFLFIYLHIARGIYYNSYRLTGVWLRGIITLLLAMAAAFVGYVLPWGQIRFWGATVITNLLSSIPYIGNRLVEWIWGGFAVDNPTLNRFYTFHFILPFIILLFNLIHINFLHITGSNNPLGIKSDYYKIPFNTYYGSKDLFGIIVALFLLRYFVFFASNALGDPDNYIAANPIITPAHIKPEWYFLWAYAILRSIPNKLGGVVLIFSAIIVIAALPFIAPNRDKISNSRYKQLRFWAWVVTVLLLSWIGASPVVDPFIWIGLLFTIMYFVLILFFII